MTLNEFKAWLEGFEASFATEGAGPDAKQWAKIKARLASVQMLATPSVGLPERLKNWPFNEPTVRYTGPMSSDSAPAPRSIYDPNQSVGKVVLE